MIRGTVVSITGNKVMTDNPIWMGPFKVNGPVYLGDKIAYQPELQEWVCTTIAKKG